MDQNQSHKQILKSTAIVGGAQIFTIIIGVFRTKVAALLLGPAGIGIIGILTATTDLVRNATGFGINFSGVKDVAESSATGEQKRIARTITILRRWALGTGLLGMLITIVLCRPLSNYAFGNENYAMSIAFISITLLISSISASQIALLQGLRQIGKMAKATLYGAILGTVITLPLYWWLGVKGIVPGMIFISIGSLIISWKFASQIKIIKPKLTFNETLKGGLNMAQLGFFIVIQGFVASATLYIIRAFITAKMNIDAVGYYQASWMISNMYVGIVLRSMLADFYPRLSAISTDNTASNKLINEQMEITLLVGSPMMITLIAFAGTAITVLYSSSFNMSIQLLQWEMSSAFISLIAWPLGIMFLAKNKGKYNVIVDAFWSVIFLFSTYWGWDFIGFNILGISSLLASLGRILLIVIITRNLGKFSFRNINLHYILVFGAITILTMLNVLNVVGYLQYIISGFLMFSAILYSFSHLRKIIDIKTLLFHFKNRNNKI